MMEPADDGLGLDWSLSLNGPMVGRILAQGEVWPVIVVIIGVGLEDPV